MTARKVILYIACSLDGYIAQPDDDLSFLNLVQKPGEDYGYKAFMDSVDTVITGRKTYDWVVAQGHVPHPDKTCYVLTRTHRPAQDNLHFYSGDLAELIQALKARPGKTIFCEGGSQVVSALLQDQLLDEMIISLVPVLVGDGTPLFQKEIPVQTWKLLSVQSFDTGLVQLRYGRV